MLNTQTMPATIQSALIVSSPETRAILSHITEDEALSYDEKYKLIDDVLAHANEAGREIVTAEVMK